MRGATIDRLLSPDRTLARGRGRSLTRPGSLVGSHVPRLANDADNGGEFINRTMVHYCEVEAITLARARPYRKNDSCHLEQKNWSVVRRLVGYARFEQVR